MILHNPDWALEFQRLEKTYLKALGKLACRIEHVGSTAIRGIAAKPILDIDIVILKESSFLETKQRLELLGYRHNGDQGIPGREAFKRKDKATPNNGTSFNWMNHNLYVCIDGSLELTRHIQFRDYLNSNAEARQEYEAIKTDVASRSNDDRKLYSEIKETEGPCSAFVEKTLKLATAQNSVE